MENELSELRLQVSAKTTVIKSLEAAKQEGFLLNQLRQDTAVLMVRILICEFMERLQLGLIEQAAENALGRPLTDHDRALCRRLYQERLAQERSAAEIEAFAQRSRDEDVMRRIVMGREDASSSSFKAGHDKRFGHGRVIQEYLLGHVSKESWPHRPGGRRQGAA